MTNSRIARRIATVLVAAASLTGIATAALHTAPAAVAAPEIAATGYDFSTYVANTGGQAAVDECTGGLTDMSAIADLDGQSYYPIHNNCGGATILTLTNGDQVHIDGLGDFTVVASRDVTQGDTTDALTGMPGTVLIQTCHNTGNAMRVVALEAN